MDRKLTTMVKILSSKQDDRVMDQWSYGTMQLGERTGRRRTSLAKRADNLASDDSRSWLEARGGRHSGRGKFSTFQPRHQTLLDANGTWITGRWCGPWHGLRAPGASEAAGPREMAPFSLAGAVVLRRRLQNALPGGPVSIISGAGSITPDTAPTGFGSL